MTADRMQQHLIEQLDVVFEEFQTLTTSVTDHDVSGGRNEQWMRFLTRGRAAIHRIAGPHSVYVEQCEEALHYRAALWARASLLAGVLTSLRSDIEAGYIKSYTELVHGELFADFLDMSQHLLDEGYKDAAAVIAGSSLEAHLRQLWQKSAIGTDPPKMAGTLNSDLARTNVYSKQDQKNVTAWLGLRNEAAHGHYERYDKAQVALLILSIRDFITRNPA